MVSLSTNRSAYLLLALTTLFWAGNSIAGKFAVGHVSPMVLVTVRWLAVALALLLFYRDYIIADWAVIRSRLPYLLIMGALGFTLFSVPLYYALVYTTAINVSILQGSMPMYVFLASFVMFSSRIVKEQALGFLVSFIGVILVAVQGHFENLLQLNINIGDVLILLAMLAYAIYTAALRSKPALHWTSLMFALCMGASITSIPMLAVETWQGATIWPDAEGLWVLLYVIIFPSLISQIFFIRAVELIGPNRAGLFINLLPGWGALLAVALVGETFHPYHAVALVLILAGIGLAEYGARRLREPPRP